MASMAKLDTVPGELRCAVVECYRRRQTTTTNDVRCQRAKQHCLPYVHYLWAGQ